MISQSAFQLQVSRHMTAAEWLVNSSYAYWQNNLDSYADLLGALSSALVCDAVAAARTLTQFALALSWAFTAAVTEANTTLENFIDERTDLEAHSFPEVSWVEALTSVLHQDFITPVVSLWAAINIWESSIWLTLRPFDTAQSSGDTLNRHI